MSVADPIRRMLRPTRPRTWSEVTADYLASPMRWWGADAPRHASKLTRKKQAIRDRDGLDDAAIIDEVIAMASRRRVLRPPPVFITGLGGSGSHWLAGMLGDAGPVVPAGEVYVPRTVLDELDQLSDADQACAIDAIHLLHGWPRTRDVWALSLVNCAAGVAKLQRCRRWFPDAVGVHLQRDPRDQVLSVTFRKDSYRGSQAPDADDEEYLRRMVRRNVAGFREYRAATPHIAVEVRYEDLTVDPRPALRAILTALGRGIDDEQVEQAVKAHDADAIRAGTGTTTSNLDEGGRSRPWDQIADPARQRMLHAHLVDVIHGLGYAPGDCMGSHLPEAGLPPRTLAFPGRPPGPLYVREGTTWHRRDVTRGSVHAEAGQPILLRVGTGDADPKVLRDLAGDDVQALCLAGNDRIDDRALPHLSGMTGLQTLDLARTAVTDEGLAALADLGGLQQLSLADTKTTPRGRSRLAAAQPQLTIWT